LGCRHQGNTAIHLLVHHHRQETLTTIYGLALVIELNYLVITTRVKDFFKVGRIAYNLKTKLGSQTDYSPS